MDFVQKVIDETRRIRTKNKIAPREKIKLIIVEGQAEGTSIASGKATIIRTESELLRGLTGAAEIEFGAAMPAGDDLLKGVTGPCEIGIIPPKPTDLAAERERLQKEIAKVEAEVAKIGRKLENVDFVAKAPAAVVAENRSRLDELRDRLAKLGQNLAKLSDPA